MRISIVAVNWNGADILHKFIENLLAIKFDDLEIIIVDNGSSDDSVEIIKSYKRIACICLPINTGFAAGNNTGINVSSGDFILLINTDVLCPPDIIIQLLKIYSENKKNIKKIGSIMPVIKLENKNINSIGSYLFADFQPFNLGFNESIDKILILQRNYPLKKFITVNEIVYLT